MMTMIDKRLKEITWVLLGLIGITIIGCLTIKIQNVNGTGTIEEVTGPSLKRHINVDTLNYE
jgi:hypothetical protein